MIARNSQPEPARVAAAVLLGAWLVALVAAAVNGQSAWLPTIVSLWFAYNFFTWYVKTWRLAILSRRGAVLAAGFVIAGAILSGFAAGGSSGVIGVAGSVLLSAALLAAPFVLNRLLRFRACRPHWSDLAVSGYLLILLHWWPLDRIDASLKMGPFVAAALGATYFLGTRYWNRVKWELSLPAKGASLTLGSIAVVAAITWFDPTTAIRQVPHAPAAILYWGTLIAPVIASLMCGVVLPTLQELGKGLSPRLRTPTAVVTTTLLYAAVTAWLTSPSIGAGAAALAGVIATHRTRHVLPAILIMASYMTVFISRSL